MTLEDALNEFLTRCAAVDLSRATITWYRDMVCRFIGSVGECEVQMVTPANARRFRKA